MQEFQKIPYGNMLSFQYFQFLASLNPFFSHLPGRAGGTRWHHRCLEAGLWEDLHCPRWNRGTHPPMLSQQAGTIRRKFEEHVQICAACPTWHVLWYSCAQEEYQAQLITKDKQLRCSKGGSWGVLEGCLLTRKERSFALHHFRNAPGHICRAGLSKEF